MDIYKSKFQTIKAMELESDAVIDKGKDFNIYLFGGDYLIEGPDKQLYPMDKKLFDFLFEKEEIYD